MALLIVWAVWPAEHALAQVQDGDPCVSMGVPGVVCTNGAGVKVCSSNPLVAIGGTCSSGGSNSDKNRERWLASEQYRILSSRAREYRARLRELKMRYSNGQGATAFSLWSPDNPFAVAEEVSILRRELSEIEARLSNYTPINRVRDPVGDALTENRGLGPRGPVFELYGGLGVESTRASATTVNSSTGALDLPGYAATTVGAEIGFVADLSRPFQLSAYEKLTFAAGLGAAKLSASVRDNQAGAFSNNSIDVPLSLGYRFGRNYILANGLFGTGTSQFSSTPGASAKVSTDGWAGDLTFGRQFELWSAKRPDGTVASLIGWRGLMLDLSGHVGTMDIRYGSFVGSLGVAHGSGDLEQSMVGGAARLTWYFRGSDYWMLPYVSAGFDHAFRTNVNLDSSLLALNQLPDESIGRVEVGVNLTSLNLITVNGRAYFAGGDTTRTTGFSLGMKFPLIAR
jgi:hypothetical protein